MGTTFIEDELFKRSSDGILSPMRSGDVIKSPSSATFVIAASDSLHPEHADYVCDGTDDQVQIQAAIDALPSTGGNVLLMEGTYIKGDVDGIDIPSNVGIMLSVGATISFKTDVGDGAVIFKNEDAVSGNSNISIIGGILDGNRTNQASGTQTAISFVGVTNSKMDSLLQNFNGRAISEDDDCSGNDIKNRLYPLVKKLDYDIDGEILKHPTVKVLDLIKNDGVWTNVGGTLTWDSSETIFGTESAKLGTTTVTGGNYKADLKKSASLAINPKLPIGILIKTDTDSLTNFEVRFSFSDGAVSREARTAGHYRIKYEINGEWVLASVVPSSIIDWEAVDWSAINAMWITVIHASNTFECWVAGVIQAYPIYDRGSVMLTFDDGCDDVYTDGMPIMNKYNYKGVAYIVPTWIGETDRMTMAELKEVYRSGWDIANHTWSHKNLPSMTIGEAEEELLKSQNWMVENGFGRTAISFAYPESAANKEIDAIIREYMAFSRGGSAVYMYRAMPLFGTATMLSFYPGVSNANLAAMKAAVDVCAESGSNVIFHMHTIGATGEITAANFEDFIDHIYNSGVKVVTFSDILKNAIRSAPVECTFSDMFMDVLGVSATHVRSNEDLSAATPITFTIDAQPDVGRTLSWSFDAHAQITAYGMEVIGTDAKGNIVTETWDETDGWSGETSNAFTTITSIKMTSRTGTGVADTMDIGITDVLGLSNVIYETGDVFKIKKNNANATVSGAQVNTTYDTYDMSVITLGAADDFTIWYKSNLNIIS